MDRRSRTVEVMNKSTNLQNCQETYRHQYRLQMVIIRNITLDL